MSNRMILQTSCSATIFRMHARKKLTQLLETSIHDVACRKCGHRAVSKIRLKSRDGLEHSTFVCMNCHHEQFGLLSDPNYQGNDFPHPREQEDGTFRVDDPEEPHTEWDASP
jgi:DNA-directed RNA polymerase subunit RPC12/RpoP